MGLTVTMKNQRARRK